VKNKSAQTTKGYYPSNVTNAGYTQYTNKNSILGCTGIVTIAEESPFPDETHIARNKSSKEIHEKNKLSKEKNEDNLINKSFLEIRLSSANQIRDLLLRISKNEESIDKLKLQITKLKDEIKDKKAMLNKQREKSSNSKINYNIATKELAKSITSKRLKIKEYEMKINKLKVVPSSGQLKENKNDITRLIDQIAKEEQLEANSITNQIKRQNQKNVDNTYNREPTDKIVLRNKRRIDININLSDYNLKELVEETQSSLRETKALLEEKLNKLIDIENYFRKKNNEVFIHYFGKDLNIDNTSSNNISESIKNGLTKKIKTNRREYKFTFLFKSVEMLFERFYNLSAYAFASGVKSPEIANDISNSKKFNKKEYFPNIMRRKANKIKRILNPNSIRNHQHEVCYMLFIIYNNIHKLAERIEAIQDRTETNELVRTLYTSKFLSIAIHKICEVVFGPKPKGILSFMSNLIRGKTAQKSKATSTKYNM